MLISIKKHPQITIYGKQVPFKKPSFLTAAGKGVIGADLVWIFCFDLLFFDWGLLLTKYGGITRWKKINRCDYYW